MTKTKTYRALREELDEVLYKLQDPACDIEDAVTLYETGLKLSKALQAQLTAVETKIDKLTT